MSLSLYKQKRNFTKTPEPKNGGKHGGRPIFVIQKHDASHLHYDFRLELDGTLKSWAVPKGPSLDPATKRLAVEVEDHPLSYASFEGTIPEGQYGAGNVIVWDTGCWSTEEDAEEAYKKGRLHFTLEGQKLAGRWTLVRMHGEGKRKNWFLIKGRDEAANRDLDITASQPLSVISGVGVDEIGKGGRKAVVKPPRPSKSITRTPKKNTQAMPDFETPLLPTLTETAPAGNQWLHEKKLDGYRTLIYKQGNEVRCLTRTGLDWAARYGEVVKVLETLPYDRVILDGEIVVDDEKGHSNFSLLQEALSDGATEKLVLYLFDILYLDGEDLRPLPLEQRKVYLEQVVRPHVTKNIQLTGYTVGRGPELFKDACKHGLEGIVSKKMGSAYVSGRSQLWLKTKCQSSGTFRIAGYSVEGKRRLKAIIMAEEVDGKLKYIGRVGTGFNQHNLDELMVVMEKLKVKEKPLALPAGISGKDVTWIKPELLAEIQYRTRTGGGVLRQASFKGLRPDKVGKETMKTVAADKPAKGKKAPALITHEDLESIVITHPERHLFGDADITKLDVAVYYAHVANYILPYILERPLSLIRCTSDNQKSCFYQRHFTPGMLKSIRNVDVTNDEGKTTKYLYFDDPKGFLEFTQAGIVEVHPWNSHVATVDLPDQIILDLDPDTSIAWKDTVQAALDIWGALKELGFTAFVKTTGGKGIHIVLPIGAEFDWDEVKGFSKELAQGCERRQPKRFTANMAKAKRVGRIFIDYLRNGKGSTAVAPYSLRARPGGPVSMPVTWEELGKLKSPLAFTFETVPEILEKRKDPWADFEKAKAGNLEALRRFLRPAKGKR